MRGGKLPLVFALGVLSLGALGMLLDGTKAYAGLYVLELFALFVLTGLSLAVIEMYELRDRRSGPFTAILFAIALANGALLLGMTELSLALIALLLFSLIGMLLGLMPALPESLTNEPRAAAAASARAARKAISRRKASKAKKKKRRR